MIKKLKNNKPNVSELFSLLATEAPNLLKLVLSLPIIQNKKQYFIDNKFISTSSETYEYDESYYQWYYGYNPYDDGHSQFRQMKHWHHSNYMVCHTDKSLKKFKWILHAENSKFYPLQSDTSYSSNQINQLIKFSKTNKSLLNFI